MYLIGRMLIKHNLRLTRIVLATWKTDVFLALTCVSVYYIHQYIPNSIPIPATLVTLLGTAIAFFVGFNNNQAYDRWWEARTIWGALVNDSRSWARFILSNTVAGSLSSEEFTQIKRQLILRHIGFVYALKENLRRSTEGYFKKLLPDSEVATVTQQLNVPNAILTCQAKDLQALSNVQAIDQFRFLQLTNLLTAFTDHMGKSERIRNTIYPPSYIYFTRLFIWVLVVFVTLVLIEPIGTWSIPIGWIIGFVFHSAHINGMGLVDPFDEIPTGISLNQIARTIEINLLQMLGEKDIPEPTKPVNDEYVL